MGGEADAGDYAARIATAGEDGDDGEESVALDWEIGLPSACDLAPLSQYLVPPELAFAFNIWPEPSRTMLDLHRASQNTFSSLFRHVSSSSSSAVTAAAALKSFPPFPSPAPATDDPMVLEGDEPTSKIGESESSRNNPPMEEADSSALRPDNSNDDHSARAQKRARLVWTPQLQKRFIDVVAHLGMKNAVPKNIMQMMNVEGLTRENVASHLQKYRLYLKRMNGFSDEGPSSSDHLFASTPVPQSLHEPFMPMRMPYAVPTMIPMPVFGMPHQHGHGSPVGMVPVNNLQGSPACNGFESHHPYGAFGENPTDWPGGNKFGSIVSYPRVMPNDK